MKGKEQKREKKKEKAEPGKQKVQSDYQKEKNRKGENLSNTKTK